jgi:hypothetical protein
VRTSESRSEKRPRERAEITARQRGSEVGADRDGRRTSSRRGFFPDPDHRAKSAQGESEAGNGLGLGDPLLR